MVQEGLLAILPSWEPDLGSFFMSFIFTFVAFSHLGDYHQQTKAWPSTLLALQVPGWNPTMSMTIKWQIWRRL